VPADRFAQATIP